MNPTALYAAVNSAWFGPHIHASTNGGKTWKLSEKGLELKCVPDQSIKRIWHIRAGHADEPGAVYAGADPGALFRSGDWGESGKKCHRSPTIRRARNGIPARAACACIPFSVWAKDSMVVAISAAGAFRTSDGGATWTPHNGGVRADFLPNKLPEVGQCVHKLLAHPNESRSALPAEPLRHLSRQVERR